MAQALFDEHPLEEYLRDNGETPLLIPGTYPALEQELVDFSASLDENSDEDYKECLPQVLLDFMEFLQTAISSAQARTPSPFVEKFKYNVISSSLLSPTLPTPPSRRSSRTLSMPGKLLHSRASSMDLDHGIPVPVPPSEPSYGAISLSTASVVALFSTGYPFLALIVLMITLLLVYDFLSTTGSYQSDMTASFKALDDLIQANQIWESVVQDAIILLESDERTLLHSPPHSTLISSHVRVALHSCLQTTHTQCDNIRNIFSALTSPAELSQLSEMYAPHSPTKAGFNPESKSRPSSFPQTYFSPNRSPRSARNSMFVSSMSAASKFTNLQPSRHPLSLPALNYAIQRAIASKRYTCSHLLALRFLDEEDEGYWEDVRSLMGLLISTLADASSRLSDALDEAEQQSLQDQIPIPSPVLPSTQDETTFGDQQNKPLRMNSRVSFAPMSNHISRFAAHVGAIGSALDDARDHLEECVSALKEDSSPSSSYSGPSPRSRRSRTFPKVAASAPEEAEAEVPVALQAYERLRRELGLALRECERGRDRLLEIVNPPIPSDEEEFDDLPSLGHDLSDDSDKTDPISPPHDDETDVAILINATQVSTTVVGGEASDAIGTLIDDATPHLLLTATTKHLPMPGIEDVFEADMGTRDVFSRERSKLTREERIKATKARRESGLGLGIAFGGRDGGDDRVEPQKMRGIEKWGPSGEVVQELKDVIWKVNEKRRKMANASQAVQNLEDS